MTVKRRAYRVNLVINERKVLRVLIDPHYEEKHGDTVNDGIILSLVKKLDGESFKPVEEKDGFKYFVNDSMFHEGEKYKLIWLLDEDEIYVGVLNAYRR